MRFWNYVETRKIGQFSVILDWTYEDSALRDCFDETVSDIAEMERRCNDYTDTHYVARVRVFYDGHEMGSSVLGSCYAYDCDPADDMQAGIDGYLEDMIDEALDEARGRCVEMVERLKRDFLEVA